jgi:tripartite-type tricarboxylate transporter receptor subunit TctC
MKLQWAGAALLAMSHALVAAEAAERGSAVAEYPNKPVRMVVPSAPGSGTDLVGRMIGQGLSEIWGRPVVIDNRGGAGGIPAIRLIAKETPKDGYTMMLGSSGHFSFAPVLYSKLPYDPYKDVTPLSIVASQPFVVAVHPSIPAASIKELIAYAKTRPGALHYGSGGAGTASHLGTELLQLSGGISMQHIAYRGSGPTMAALISGEIQVQMPGLAQAMPFMSGGKIKVLALTGAKRSRVAPDLPTVAESGLPGFEFDVWYGLIFPGGMPRDILMRANAGVVKAVQSPAVNQRFTALGMEPVSNTPEEFAALIRRDAPKWERVVKAANIKVE